MTISLSSSSGFFSMERTLYKCTVTERKSLVRSSELSLSAVLKWFLISWYWPGLFIRPRQCPRRIVRQECSRFVSKTGYTQTSAQLEAKQWMVWRCREAGVRAGRLSNGPSFVPSAVLFFLNRTLKYRLIEEVILVSCPRGRLLFFLACWAALYSGPPHLTSILTYLRPSSRRTGKWTSHSHSACSHFPGCAHTPPPHPVSHGLWKMPLATLLIPSHGLATPAPLHSPHHPWRVPRAQCLGLGCRSPGKQMLSSSRFGCFVCSLWMERARASCPLVLPRLLPSSLHMAMLNTQGVPHPRASLDPTLCLLDSRSFYIFSSASLWFIFWIKVSAIVIPVRE